jgi:hypothetical protein
MDSRSACALTKDERGGKRMNTASKVDELIQKWIKETDSKAEIAVNIAEACIGWSYVFGARGEYCTPANRRKRD